MIHFILKYRNYIALFLVIIVSIGSVSSQHNQEIDSVSALSIQANCFFETSDYKNALHCYERLENLTRSSNIQMHNHALVKIASIYSVLDKNEFSYTYFKRAYKLSELNKDTINLAYSLNGIGNYFRYKNKKDTALIFYSRALELFNKIFYFKGIAGINNNIANFNFSEGNYSIALAHYLKSYKIAKSNNFIEDQKLYLINIGASYYKLDQKDSAIFCFTEVINDSTQKMTLPILRAYNELYKVYKKNNNYKKSLYYLELHESLSDSIFNKTLEEEIAKIKVASEISNKETELILMNKQKELDASHITKQFYLILLLGLLLLFLITFSYHFYRRKEFQAVQLSDKIAEEVLNNKLKIIENELLKEKNEKKSREILSIEILNTHKNDTFLNIQKLVNQYKSDKKDTILHEIYHQIKNNNRIQNDWEAFKLHFEEVHPVFFDKLKEKYPDLTQNNLKLCAYIKIGFSNKEIASLLNVDSYSVKRAKIRLKKKMNIDMGTEFSI